MDWERRCMRLCAGVLMLAVVLRLWAGGALVPIGRALQSDEAASFLLYLQTGRVVRLAPEPDGPEMFQIPDPVAKIAGFSAEDLELVELSDEPGLGPDLESRLTAPVELTLNDGQPRVLILHSHTTESFQQTADRYEESQPQMCCMNSSTEMILPGESISISII